MKFRLTTIFWVVAILASAIATFGPFGTAAALLVVAFWSWMFRGPRIEINSVVSALIVAGVVLVLLFLLLPAVQSARSAAYRNQCASNLKQIALALMTYHDQHGHFPPPYLIDKRGNPLHSWRVLILPYVEEQLLYSKYDFDEPWDGPNNRKLASQVPEVFRCPSQGINSDGAATETNYFAVVGSEAVWPGSGAGRRLREFQDGRSRTLMLIEASGQGVNWMEPRDVSMDDAIAMLTNKAANGHIHISDGWLTISRSKGLLRNAAMADGRVLWLGRIRDSDFAKSLLTVAGRETYSAELGEAYGTFDEYETVIKWDVVSALVTFVGLSLLPIIKFRRDKRALSRGNMERL